MGSLLDSAFSSRVCFANLSYTSLIYHCFDLTRLKCIPLQNKKHFQRRNCARDTSGTPHVLTTEMSSIALAFQAVDGWNIPGWTFSTPHPPPPGALLNGRSQGCGEIEWKSHLFLPVPKAAIDVASGTADRRLWRHILIHWLPVSKPKG